MNKRIVQTVLQQNLITATQPPASAVAAAAAVKPKSRFRQSFEYPKNAFDKTNGWLSEDSFVGLNDVKYHLNMATNREREESVPCLIEVHDARIPLDGRGSTLRDLLCLSRLRVLVLNKADLVDKSQCKQLEKQILGLEDIKHVLWTSTIDSSFFPELKRFAGRIIREVLLLPHKQYTSVDYFRIPIIGLPGVGKTSLMRKMCELYKDAPWDYNREFLQGVTSAPVPRDTERCMMLHNHPPIRLIDTKGVGTPELSRVDEIIKLAVCGNIPTDRIGNHTLSDYILFWCNKFGHTEYVEECGLKQQTDVVDDVLFAAARKWNLNNVNCAPDLSAAADRFVQLFGAGRLGKGSLDEDHLTVGEQLAGGGNTKISVGPSLPEHCFNMATPPRFRNAP